VLPRASIWGLTLLGCTTLIPILIGPVIVGVLIDSGGFTPGDAGLTAGYGAVGSVAVALACALTMHRLPLRSLALAGMVLGTLANALAAFTFEDRTLFYVLRAVSAMGEGAAYAAIMSAFAREEGSERCYGLFMMLQFGIAGVFLWALPTYLPDLSVQALYLGFALLQLALLPMVTLLPARAADVAGISIRGSEWRLLFAVPALAGLVALCFSEASNIGTDAYLERVALLAGLSDAEVGMSLGLASVLGMPGAFAILFVGARFGHAVPVLVGFVIGSLSLVGIMRADSYGSFFLFTSIHSVAWAFVTPYIQSVLADLDPGGAVVTAGGIASGAGAGIGPAVTGHFVTESDYSGVLSTGLAAFALAAIAITIAARGIATASRDT
jgi:hypothetical protein